MSQEFVKQVVNGGAPSVYSIAGQIGNSVVKRPALIRLLPGFSVRAASNSQFSECRRSIFHEWTTFTSEFYPRLVKVEMVSSGYSTVARGDVLSAAIAASSRIHHPTTD